MRRQRRVGPLLVGFAGGGGVCGTAEEHECFIIFARKCKLSKLSSEVEVEFVKNAKA